jgi:hypothetical protein
VIDTVTSSRERAWIRVVSHVLGGSTKRVDEAHRPTVVV